MTAWDIFDACISVHIIMELMSSFSTDQRGCIFTFTLFCRVVLKKVVGRDLVRPTGRRWVRRGTPELTTVNNLPCSINFRGKNICHRTPMLATSAA